MFHFKDVCFGVYFVRFKFIPELFILFLCVSISIRALRLSFVDLEQIASVFESECLTSHNFDRSGAPYANAPTTISSLSTKFLYEKKMNRI